MTMTMTIFYDEKVSQFFRVIFFVSTQFLLVANQFPDDKAVTGGWVTTRMGDAAPESSAGNSNLVTTFSVGS